MSERRKRKPIAAQSQATQKTVGGQIGNQNAAKERADAARAVAAQSQATQRKTNAPNSKNDGDNRLIVGKNTIEAERRLRKDRPDLYALHRLLRSDRKPTGGFVLLAKYARTKGVTA